MMFDTAWIDSPEPRAISARPIRPALRIRPSTTCRLWLRARSAFAPATISVLDLMVFGVAHLTLKLK